MERAGSPAQSLDFTSRKEEKRERNTAQARSNKPRSSGSSRSHFHSRPTGKNTMMWPHPVVPEAGRCGLLQQSNHEPHKDGRDLVTKRRKREWALGTICSLH